MIKNFYGVVVVRDDNGKMVDVFRETKQVKRIPKRKPNGGTGRNRIFWFSKTIDADKFFAEIGRKIQEGALLV